MSNYYVKNNPYQKIPTSKEKDILLLKSEILDSLDVIISFQDAYEMWMQFSDECAVYWLDINFCPEGNTREEFLRGLLEKYGSIV